MDPIKALRNDKSYFQNISFSLPEPPSIQSNVCFFLATEMQVKLLSLCMKITWYLVDTNLLNAIYCIQRFCLFWDGFLSVVLYCEYPCPNLKVNNDSHHVRKLW